MSSAANETGRSIARMLRTCNKSEQENVSTIGKRSSRLQLTVLQDITNDTELIKVTTSSLRTERFLESDLNVADRVLVPASVHGHIRKPKNEKILDHLLTEVMINTEGLIFGPVLLQGAQQFAGRVGVLSERLFNDYAIDTALGNITMFLQIFANRDKDTGRKGEVEETVTFFGLIMRFDLFQMRIQTIESVTVLIISSDVRQQRLELID